MIVLVIYDLYLYFFVSVIIAESSVYDFGFIFGVKF